MSWDTNESTNPVIKCQGESIEQEIGDVFADAVRGVANDLGVQKFDVKLNGEAVEPSTAPDELSDGDEVVIEPTKGCRQ